MFIDDSVRDPCVFNYYYRTESNGSYGQSLCQFIRSSHIEAVTGLSSTGPHSTLSSLLRGSGSSLHLPVTPYGTTPFLKTRLNTSDVGPVTLSVLFVRLLFLDVL